MKKIKDGVKEHLDANIAAKRLDGDHLEWHDKQRKDAEAQTTYEVKTRGRNDQAYIDGGLVHIGDVRVVGKTDIEIIPVAHIQRVALDRKAIRSNVVTLQLAGESIELKMPQGEAFVKALAAEMRR